MFTYVAKGMKRLICTFYFPINFMITICIQHFPPGDVVTKPTLGWCFPMPVIQQGLLLPVQCTCTDHQYFSPSFGDLCWRCSCKKPVLQAHIRNCFSLVLVYQKLSSLLINHFKIIIQILLASILEVYNLSLEITLEICLMMQRNQTIG